MASIKITSAKGGTGGLENYLKKEEKTEQLLMSGKDCNIDRFAKDFEITRNIHQNTGGRQHYHIIQSFDKGEVTPEKAHEIGQRFAEHNKFQGFQVAIVTHKDKEHIHNHIVVNSVSSQTGKKFQQSKSDLYRMRDFSDKLCLERGLSIINNRQKEKGRVIAYNHNKYKALEKHFQGKSQSYVINTVLAVDEALEKSTSKDEFIRNINDLGYKADWKENKKNVTFEKDGKKVRLSRLAKTFSNDKYSKEGLKNEFERVKTRGLTNDFEYLQDNRGTEHNNSKGLLRTHEQLEQGQRQTIENTREEHTINEGYNREQPRVEGRDNREERRQQKNNSIDKQGKSRENSRLSKSNDKQTGRLYTSNEITSSRSEQEQRPNKRDRGRIKTGSIRNEKENININKTNDYSNFNNFSFDYLPNYTANIEEIKKNRDKKIVKYEKGYDITMINEKYIDIARKANIAEYLRNQGYTLNRDGVKNGSMNYKVEEMPGLVVAENGKWYDFNNNKGGKAIDFLVEYENMDFKEAVKTLNTSSIDSVEENIQRDIINQDFEKPRLLEEKIKLPTPAKDNKRAFAYLTKTRGMNKDLVNALINKGLVYQTDRGNVAFVGCNEKNEAKYCFERSTISDSNWKGETKGSQKEYSFNIKGQSDTLYVYESPIDLISHTNLNKEALKGSHRLSLGGVTDKALNKYLNNHRGINRVVLCLDNDNTGRKSAKEIESKLKDRGFKVSSSFPVGKDWNQDLIAKKEKQIEQKRQREINKSRSRGMSR